MAMALEGEGGLLGGLVAVIHMIIIVFFQPFHLGDVTTRGRSDRYYLWVRARVRVRGRVL